MQLKTFITISFIAIAGITNAQNTKKEMPTEKFSTQLKNGTLPGLVFAPQTTALNPNKENNNRQHPANTPRDIRQNKSGLIKSSNGTAASPVTATARETNTVFASDRKPTPPVKDSLRKAAPIMPKEQTQ